MASVPSCLCAFVPSRAVAAFNISISFHASCGASSSTSSVRSPLNCFTSAALLVTELQEAVSAGTIASQGTRPDRMYTV